MRFVIIYHNSNEVRQQVVRQIIELITKGANLETGNVNAPGFSTRTRWPNLAEMVSFPMHIQCEEGEWNGQQLTSLRQLVIDAEFVVVSDEEVCI